MEALIRTMLVRLIMTAKVFPLVPRRHIQGGSIHRLAWALRGALMENLLGVHQSRAFIVVSEKGKGRLLLRLVKVFLNG